MSTISTQTRRELVKAIREPRLAAGAQQQTVPAQVLEEEQRPDALVAVAERVILDHEVEDMGSPRLRARIQRLAREGLLDCAEDRGQRVTAFLAEERTGLPSGREILAQPRHGDVRVRDR